jgi:hypothetical protein
MLYLTCFIKNERLFEDTTLFVFTLSQLTDSSKYRKTFVYVSKLISIVKSGEQGELLRSTIYTEIQNFQKLL